MMRLFTCGTYQNSEVYEVIGLYGDHAICVQPGFSVRRDSLNKPFYLDAREQGPFAFVKFNTTPRQDHFLGRDSLSFQAIQAHFGQMVADPAPQPIAVLWQTAYRSESPTNRSALQNGYKEFPSREAALEWVREKLTTKAENVQLASITHKLVRETVIKTIVKELPV